MENYQNYQAIINQQMEDFKNAMQSDKYPALSRAASPLGAPPAPIHGRDHELSELRLNLRNPEKANVILLGEPGSGKTALVQGFTHDVNSTQYLTVAVDVERLAQDPEGDKDAEMANGLLDLVKETREYSIENNIIVTLFIDEFHRIAMISPSSVEALKPILEKSAQNGFRVIAATTFEEYDQWIAPNRALDQRLLRMDLPELSRQAVMNILESRAKRYNVDTLADDTIFGEIYDSAKQYLPSNSQPRASIDILLNMVGNITKTEYMQDGELHREYSTPEELGLTSKYPLSHTMLNRVIQRSYGIDIDNDVNIDDVKKALRTKIFNQDQAVESVISRLEMSLVGFNDKTRPKISFLSTGTTGTGKTELAKVITDALNIPLKRFDMSRYPRPEDAVEFANELALAAWSAPNGYILIDEAEKSTKQCMNTLLQVLDDARLTAANNANRVISFAGNIINLTTNLGSEVFQHSQRFSSDDDGKGYIDTDLVYKSLSDSPQFETAVLGRIDAIVPFKALPKIAIYSISKKELQTNLDIIKSPYRPILISPDILPHVVIDRTSNDSEHGGARDAKRNVKNIVIQPLSHYIAKGRPEVPLIMHLTETPRFRDSRIGDTKVGDITVEECYPMASVDNLLAQLSQKLGKSLKNEGLYIPKKWSSEMIVTEILRLFKAGSTSFKSTVDIDKVILIDGSQSLDINNNLRFINAIDAKELAEQKRKAKAIS